MSKQGRDHCYVAFEIAGEDALQRLTKVVAAIAADRSSGEHRDENTWSEFLTEQELATFWRPDDAERAEWEEFEQSARLTAKADEELPEPPWDFLSLFSMLTQFGDFELIGVRRIDDTRGVLEFDPEGDPFGGTGVLRALVRAFGHNVTGYDDGTGFVAGDPQPPLWKPKSTA